MFQSCVPNPENLRDFVVEPHSDQTRFHCTMIRHEVAEEDKNNPSTSYTLYLEHLGGFIPILKGKKISKIRPEFVIFDPTMDSEFENSGFYRLTVD